jgi:hypothetical protein
MHRFHGGCTKQLFITQSFVVTLLLTANIVTLAPVGSVIAQRNVPDTYATVLALMKLLIRDIPQTLLIH